MERVRYAATSIQRFRERISVRRIFSPYIENFTERIEFDGKEIFERGSGAPYGTVSESGGQDDVGRALNRLQEFELVTAVGLSYFAEEKADFVILGSGTGRKGDSTNICDKPIVTAITSIAFDHMAQLGNTLELIAADKAGILKADVPAVVCVPDAGPMEVIRARAKELRRR